MVLGLNPVSERGWVYESGVGRYFVDMQPGEYGLSTACELALFE